jgi:hypothetical protein
MSEHLTVIRQYGTGLAAYCIEHAGVGMFHNYSPHGFNAAVTEARFHDAVSHDVYRDDEAYRCALTAATECPYTFSHTRHWCGYDACRDS